MMIRPRSYSVLNRAVAKAISHSVNDYYRQKNRQEKYNNTYQNYNSTKTNNTNRDESVGGIVWITLILMAFIGLAVVFPWLWYLYFVFIVFGFIVA